jgi:hypothetical protein
MRFEYLEAIVRIAVQKYKAAAGGDVSSALEILMTGHVAPFFNHRGDRGGGDGAALASDASATGTVAEGDAAAEAALAEHTAAHTPNARAALAAANHGGGGGGGGGSPHDEVGVSAEQCAQRAAGSAPLAGKASQVLFADPNAWRLGALYKRPVDDTLQAHQRMLDMVYASYSK